MSALDTTLATDYEAIRRQQHELLNDLLDVLPKIENLSEDRLTQLRDARFHADNPFLVVFVGPFSSGKSSLINALLGGTPLLRVGPVPTTDRITMVRYGDTHEVMTGGGDVDTVFTPAALLRRISLVDTPGLESVFRRHEDTTRRFLHRSDVVFLVMLATQAMTASNLDALKTLRGFGKTIIILINQADLLSPEERETVRTYVQEQSQAHLGARPEVWMVSATLGQRAQQTTPRDALLWADSGLGRIEVYVDDQLGDVARMRQKLQTPLQIAQSVTGAALDTVRSSQSVLDQYRAIADNIDAQLAACRREQDKTVRQTTEAVSRKFGEATARTGAALREQFRLTRAPSAAGQGVLALVGLGRLLRTAEGTSALRTALERHKALEPLHDLAALPDDLAATLEGRDIQDMDNLVHYAQREIDALPPATRAKMIGRVQPPMRYNRAPLQNAREALGTVEDAAQQLLLETLDTARHNMLIVMAVVALVLAVAGIGALVWLINDPGPTPAILLGSVIVILLLAMLLWPLRGRLLQADFANRMIALQARYTDALRRAADEQVAYGMGLREDVVRPLVRLVEAQTAAQADQLAKLQAAQGKIAQVEQALARMGRPRSPLG